MHRVKIICTLGPATSTKTMLEKLISAGMNVARLNLSHGSHTEHARIIKLLRSISKKAGREIGILCDLQGPKLRVGDLPESGILLKKGSEIQLTPSGPANESSIPVNYAKLSLEVKKGHKILLDDGKMELKVLSTKGKSTRCRVIHGGTLFSRKGMNLPDSDISIPAITKKDRADLRFALEHGADIIALSFVRSADDVKKLRKIIKNSGNKNPDILAKIETPRALENIDGIICASDGIMIARGDLGIELGNEKVPKVQKDLILECNYLGKPVITATQMLESMLTSPVPSRADASDIANAVYDGTDAVMLSGETSMGNFPAKAVATMRKIIMEAEKRLESLPAHPAAPTGLMESAIAEAAIAAAIEANASAIACITRSGLTARFLAQQRPMMPIFAVSNSTKTLRKLSSVWGLGGISVSGPDAISPKRLQKKVADTLKKRLGLEKGSLIVFTFSFPDLFKGVSDTVKIHTLDHTR